MLIKESFSVQIYLQLRAELMAGRYEPGQKLKLIELAGRLGVSVTPVREAIARLISDQVLVQHDHRSAAVAVMDMQDFDEVRELRLDLEGKTCERAATCATPDDIAALKAIHTRLVAAREQHSYADVLLENQRFHLTLCQAARMPVAFRIVEGLWVQCGPLMHGMKWQPGVRPKLHPHLAVIKALQAGDGTLARQALQQDIQMSTQTLRTYLTGHSDRPGWAKRLQWPGVAMVPAATERG